MALLINGLWNRNLDISQDFLSDQRKVIPVFNIIKSGNLKTQRKKLNIYRLFETTRIKRVICDPGWADVLVNDSASLAHPP